MVDKKVTEGKIEPIKASNLQPITKPMGPTTPQSAPLIKSETIKSAVPPNAVVTEQPKPLPGARKDVLAVKCRSIKMYEAAVKADDAGDGKLHDCMKTVTQVTFEDENTIEGVMPKVTVTIVSLNPQNYEQGKKYTVEIK